MEPTAYMEMRYEEWQEGLIQLATDKYCSFCDRVATINIPEMGARKRIISVCEDCYQEQKAILFELGSLSFESN